MNWRRINYVCLSPPSIRFPYLLTLLYTQIRSQSHRTHDTEHTQAAQKGKRPLARPLARPPTTPAQQPPRQPPATVSATSYAQQPHHASTPCSHTQSQPRRTTTAPTATAKGTAGSQHPQPAATAPASAPTRPERIIGLSRFAANAAAAAAATTRSLHPHLATLVLLAPTANNTGTACATGTASARPHPNTAQSFFHLAGYDRLMYTFVFPSFFCIPIFIRIIISTPLPPPSSLSYDTHSCCILTLYHIYDTYSS